MTAPSGSSFDGAEHLRLDVLARHQVIHLGTFAARWFHRLWNTARSRKAHSYCVKAAMTSLTPQEARFLCRLLA